MKAIYTTNRHGVCRATDNDGNRYRESSTAYQYDEGHQAAVIGLCQKLNWHGTLQGSYRLKAGRNDGMVWVWLDERNPQVRV